MVRRRHDVPGREWKHLAMRMGRTAATLRAWGLTQPAASPATAGWSDRRSARTTWPVRAECADDILAGLAPARHPRRATTVGSGQAGGGGDRVLDRGLVPARPGDRGGGAPVPGGDPHGGAPGRDRGHRHRGARRRHLHQRVGRSGRVDDGTARGQHIEQFVHRHAERLARVQANGSRGRRLRGVERLLHRQVRPWRDLLHRRVPDLELEAAADTDRARAAGGLSGGHRRRHPTLPRADGGFVAMMSTPPVPTRAWSSPIGAASRSGSQSCSSLRCQARVPASADLGRGVARMVELRARVSASGASRGRSAARASPCPATCAASRREPIDRFRGSR